MLSPLARLMCAFCVGVLLVSLSCMPGGKPKPEEVLPAETGPPRLLDGLGDHHHPIHTPSRLAQRYFDQGLVLTFGFNHEAAVNSFEAALEADPECAMCSWGVALALGPNINAPMGPEAGKRAYAAVQRALAASENGDTRERAYIEALAQRYREEPRSERGGLDQAYADAMRGVHEADPRDLDAAVLFAESLMDLSPWNYWTDDAEPREYTEEVLALLEGVLEEDPKHVGANHYLIHAVEEHYPERGVAAAERLGTLAPDAGHLVHMPSHIFWRVGRYEEAKEINRRAAAADEAFFATCRAGAFYRAAYYPHNLHFLWAAAAAEGSSDLALSAARKLEARTLGRVDVFPFLQDYVVIPALTLARFGHWDSLLALDAPPEKYVYRRGIWHYVRGLAQLRSGHPAEARSELAALLRIAERPEAEELALAGGVATAAQLLLVGHAHLSGEIAAAEGDLDTALIALGLAVARQDELAYMEPPPWYFPVRQALGAVLLDAGDAGAAELVYRRDLEDYPGNGWSLYGLARSLDQQGLKAEATWAQQGFETAWARADVELEASRF